MTMNRALLFVIALPAAALAQDSTERARTTAGDPPATVQRLTLAATEAIPRGYSQRCDAPPYPVPPRIFFTA